MIDIVLYLVLAFADLLYTRFMLSRHGLGIEINPLIPYLVRRFGLGKGLAFGILGPTALVCYAGQFFHPLLETLLLARFMLFFLQAHRLRIELAPDSQRPRPVSR